MSQNLHRLMENQHTVVASAAGGTIPVVGALANQAISIYRMILTTAAAVTVTIQDTGAAALSAPFAFGAAGGTAVLDIPINGDPWFQSGLGLGVQLSVSAPVAIAADIYWLAAPVPARSAVTGVFLSQSLVGLPPGNAGDFVAAVTVTTSAGPYLGQVTLAGPDASKFALTNGGFLPCNLVVGAANIAGGSYNISLMAN